MVIGRTLSLFHAVGPSKLSEHLVNPQLGHVGSSQNNSLNFMTRTTSPRTREVGHLKNACSRDDLNHPDATVYMGFSHLQHCVFFFLRGALNVGMVTSPRDDVLSITDGIAMVLPSRLKA